MSIVTFAFVEVLEDGITQPRDPSNIKLRQWKKTSPHMASQVRDSPIEPSLWRSAQLAVEATIPLSCFLTYPTFTIALFRHWKQKITREAAQRRDLVVVSHAGVVAQHESLVTGATGVSIILTHATMIVTVPLLPKTFKLPSSTGVWDEWQGQARSMEVFFVLLGGTPAGVLGLVYLPSLHASMQVEQYPKRRNRRGRSVTEDEEQQDDELEPEDAEGDEDSASGAASAAVSSTATTTTTKAQATSTSTSSQPQPSAATGAAAPPQKSSEASSSKTGDGLKEHSTDGDMDGPGLGKGKSASASASDGIRTKSGMTKVETGASSNFIEEDGILEEGSERKKSKIA